VLSRSTRTRVKSTGIIDLKQVLTNFVVYAINGLCQILQQFSRDLKTEPAGMTDSTLGVCRGAVEQLHEFLNFIQAAAAHFDNPGEGYEIR